MARGQWVKIGGISDLYNGRAFKPTDWTENGLPIVRIQNLNDQEAEYNYYSGNVEEQYALHGGELLFAWSGTPGTSFGAHIWWGKEAVLNQHIFKMKFDENMLNKRYFMYAINQQLNRLISVAHGGAGLQHVTKGVFENTPTQERIVSFIDEEFRRLDEAKDQLQSVLNSSEERKQSILHKAFTGALTDNWRHEHGISKTTWQNMKLKDACDGLKYGTSSKSGKIGIVPVIRMGNLQHGEIDWDNLVYSNDAEDNEKYLLKTGDVLFNRTNSPEWVGKTSIYRGERPAIYAGYLVKLDYKPELLLGEYLNFVMNSPEAKTYCNAVKTDGVNQSNISAKKIGEFIIPVPSINEQNEIVRILDRLSDSEKVAKKIASAALDQLEETRKSILSIAFRGELIR